MLTPLGRVTAVVRYPVKSMAGVPAESAVLGWHGLAGDRRFAFRRVDDIGDFPWLTAIRLPELVLYHPQELDARRGVPLLMQVRTPAGVQRPLRSPELANEIAERVGSRVELMQLRHGIFDEGTVSVIARSTIAAIGRASGQELDPRRFRANILLELDDATPFAEDQWVGSTLVFGETDPRPTLSVTAPDIRCMMINLDPDSAKQDAKVLRSVVALNDNTAGVYGTVVQVGAIRVGQVVSLVRGASLGHVT